MSHPWCQSPTIRLANARISFWPKAPGGPCTRAHWQGKLCLLGLSCNPALQCLPLQSLPRCGAVPPLPSPGCPSDGGAAGGHTGAQCDAVGQAWPCSRGSFHHSPLWCCSSQGLCPLSPQQRSLFFSPRPQYVPTTLTVVIKETDLIEELTDCPFSFWDRMQHPKFCEAVTMKWGLLSWDKPLLK